MTAKHKTPPIPPPKILKIKINKNIIMPNRNTKHWLFTWETNVSQKNLPNKNKLNL